MAKYLNEVLKKETPQSEPIFGREDEMVKNNAGGYTFTISKFDHFKRFLVLGSEKGTFYQGERELTRENAGNTIACVKEDGKRVVDTILEFSAKRRLPKEDTALFSLALVCAYGDDAAQKHAFGNLHRIARTGSQFLQFVSYVDSMRGWGSALRKSVSKWYEYKAENNFNSLVYQTLKYQNRHGWTHRDVLRKAHPKSAAGNEIFRYITHGTPVPEVPQIQAFERAKTVDTDELVRIIKGNKLTREMVPSEHHSNSDVMRALFDDMPLGAMVRNLNNLTRHGVLAPMSQELAKVTQLLSNKEHIRKAGLHPINLMVALDTYKSGKGRRGSTTWTPVPQVVDALDTAIPLSFDTVAPTGKRIYLGVDVSGSMTWEYIAGTHISAREAAAVMALVIAKNEPNYYMSGFASASGRSTWGRAMSTYELTGNRIDGLIDLGITAKDSMATTLEKMNDLDFGGTDCALPVIDALKKKMPVDCFVVITDSESWAGKIHVKEALEKYRNEMGIPAKMVILAMTATRYSLSDPSDPLSLDIPGMDSSVPQVLASFIES